jgi:hypothetical protein
MSGVGSVVFVLAAAAVAGMSVKVDEQAQRYTIEDNGQPVLTYNFGTVPVPAGVGGKYAVARSDYVHPLYGPNGEVLTKDYSPEHPHHRGVYWAWPEVTYRGETRDLHALQGVFARPVKMLRPGGRLLVSVPALDSLPAAWFGRAWYPLGLPLHLTHFTRATLSRHLEAAGFGVERFIPIRSGGYVRESFRYLADDTGRRLHRALSRSRFIAGLLSYWALAARRSSLMVALARRA